MKKIPLQKGYPTSDGKVHPVHADAVKHQTDLDLIAACEGDLDAKMVKAFLKKNTEVVKDYIAKHLTEKPAPKAASNNAASDKKDK